MKKIQVIVSTFGPLHLLKSAEILNKYVQVTVIQGWIPSWWNKWVLSIASNLVGRDLFKSFKRRTPDCLKGNNKSIGFAEFYLWACKLFKLQTPLKSSYNAACIYGWSSKRHIKNADVLHVRSGSGFCGAIEKARKKGIKVVVDHSIAHPMFMDKQLREEYTRNNVVFDLGMDNPFWTGIVSDCKKGDVVLVNSQFVKDTFVANGFAPEKIKVILLGVREDFFFLKKDYSIKDNTIKILFTGSFGFRKGAEYILKALAELHQEGFKYEFTCVGNSMSSTELIAKYNIKHINRVNTIPQEELKTYLATSDIYLFPSLCEGCASSGMEAMAAGMPVIATIESGLPIEDGVNGIIVRSKNVHDIKNAIKLLASDTRKRETLGLAAANKIATHYTWDNYAQNVFSLYNQLLNNPTK